MLDQDQLFKALATVIDPLTGKDFVTTKAIKDVKIDAGQVSFEVTLGYPAQSQHAALGAHLAQACQALDGVQSVRPTITTRIAAHAVQRGVPLLPKVKNTIAIASGKGGVGKSTTAANLALALAAEGAKVGLLDADIYGPSQPMMMGVSGRPDTLDGKTMSPKWSHGIEVMSIGFLVEPHQAMIWRGPMATQALEQLLRQTAWGENFSDALDYLIIDMPPGTGDIALTLSQRVPLTGVVIVTTPQDIALLDARKAITMFAKVSVPIVGLVENMAMHTCSQCGHVEHIFGADGGKNMAQELGINYLGSLPLAIQIRQQADGGCPSVAVQPQGTIAKQYGQIARSAAAQIAMLSRDFSSKFPTVTVAKDS